MGLFDNVKSRLGFGGQDYDPRGQERYGDAGGYYEDEGYAQEEYYEEDGYDAYNNRPAPMRSFGVDRADYYSDNHAPLVSQSDVRAQPLRGNVPPRQPSDRMPAERMPVERMPVDRMPVDRMSVDRMSVDRQSMDRMAADRQPVDRIPAPKPYRRSSPEFMPSQQEEDALAFKNGLARTSNASLSQLHSERLRMENSGKIVAIGSEAARESTAALYQHHASGAFDPAATGQVRQRRNRMIESVVPATYADAEQISAELKKGAIVLLDLRSTRPDLAKRILDFSFGVASVLEGQVERYADRVYIFTSNGALLDSERAAIRV